VAGDGALSVCSQFLPGVPLRSTGDLRARLTLGSLDGDFRHVVIDLK
jgi:hypothetical protein